MQLISLNNVGRKFQKERNSLRAYYQQIGDFWVLRNVYMSVDKGEIVGVIGRNGSGKTTLLNIISGTLPVSEGEVVANGKISALLTLGAGFQNEFTGRENVYLNASLLGLRRQDIDRCFADILEFSELGDFINAPLGSYSAGMRLRLGFSAAIHNDFDILLTDEIIAVGDISFQKKCFQKMLEFKEQGKSMLMVTQDMAMIQRFCDRVYLLEDGKILFNGNTSEAIERYEMLLTKKKILSESSRLDMVKETKRWATDIVDWGKKEGSGEAVIEKVVIRNKWGRRINKIRPRGKISIIVNFTAEEQIDNFHFGVAFFREDGVYCYGPNTKFDGLPIKQMGKGKAKYELKIKELSLMPGIYYFSVAIWDEKETFAYDYHRCAYRLEIIGNHFFGQLLTLSSFWGNHGLRRNFALNMKKASLPNLDCLVDKWGFETKNDSAALISLKLLNNYGSEDSVFVSGREVRFKIDFEINMPPERDTVLWLGVYRSDGVYCHGNIKEISGSGLNSEILTYPELRLLPGGYRVSVGIWDCGKKKFLVYSHGIHPFNIISEKRDHGTVYLEHSWRWRLPKAGR